MTEPTPAPLTPEEKRELRESFAAGMRQDRNATAVFARADIARLLATLDRERATPSLDVERLARALFAWDRSEHDWVVEGDWPLAEPRWRAVAGTIAAEYARLAEPTDD